MSETQTEPTTAPEETTEAAALGDAPAATRSQRLRTLVRRPATIAVAAAVLGLVVGGLGGYGVSRTHQAGSDDAGDTTAALALPDTLSGGYKRSKTVDTEIASSVSSAQQTLGAGTDMALYTYKKKQVLIEATRLPGRALLSAGMTYAKVGDAVCASTSGSTGTEAICTRTDDALTVQVTAADATTAAKYVDEVYGSLA